MKKARGFNKKTIALVLMVCSTISFMGCGAKKDAAKDDGKVDNSPISMQLIYSSAEVPDGTAPLFKKLQENTGVTINPTWVPSASAPDKTTASIAGGKVPEVICIRRTEMRSKVVNDAIDGGLFWDLTDYIDQYPNLKTIPDFVRQGLEYDGKIYGIPRMVLNRGGGLVYRNDWAEKFGIKDPKTLDDFYNMFDKFTNNDPDGNGKKDTVGLAIFNGVFVRPLLVAAGCPMDWWIDEKTNEVKPIYVNENFLPYLDFMKKLYDEGLINKDFASTKLTQARSIVNKGEAGSIPTNIGNVTTSNEYNVLYETFPNADLKAITSVKQPDGTLAAEQSTGFSSMYCISKQAAPTETRLKQILQFFNDTMDEDNMALFVKGEEGVHYKETDGKFEWIDQEKFAKDAAGLDSLYVTSTGTEGIKLGNTRHAKEYYDFQVDTNVKDYPNINTWFRPNTDASGVSGIVEGAATKYVMGQISRDEVKNTIDKWLSGGGQSQIDDWTAQYKKILENKKK